MQIATLIGPFWPVTTLDAGNSIGDIYLTEHERTRALSHSNILQTTFPSFRNGNEHVLTLVGRQIQIESRSIPTAKNGIPKSKSEQSRDKGNWLWESLSCI